MDAPVPMACRLYPNAHSNSSGDSFLYFGTFVLLSHVCLFGDPLVILTWTQGRLGHYIRVHFVDYHFRFPTYSDVSQIWWFSAVNVKSFSRVFDLVRTINPHGVAMLSP